ncbi:RNA polymerase II C-terminal domain kinase beta subunit [Marasmius tenuissimus]|uniref:RNA polymerase II C-terminal domain kinase beta subunit n=1 Tax=Marasmius tenuissimus TaxID=585030 RepID=A0ABR3A8K0_9AGAR|nr:RNA polymerase II C-terminal domain kinase beta subunit [Marasmius tenuissimus]
MDPYSRAQSPSHLPAASSMYHRPYFTPSEVEILSEKQRGKMNATQEEKVRQSACAFLEAVGSRIGFPRKTVATAQSLYHRFHLFFPRKDFNYFDVALAALYVSAKMHDTLKKPRELLAVSYGVRYPELAAKSKHPAGDVDLDAMDPALVEHDRQRLLAVERLILETICFNFTSRMPFPYVIKIGKELGADKNLTKLAWRLAIDSHRTLVPIQYPPHTVALGGIYVASLLSSFEQEPASSEARSAHKIAAILGQHGPWEAKFQSHVEDLEAIAHTIVDLLTQGAQNPSANTSPRTPSSPSPHPSPRDRYLSSSSAGGSAQMVSPPFIPYKSDHLIRLKIAMREKDHEPLPRKSYQDTEAENVLGRNEGTVRFLFEPPGFQGRS